MPTGPWLRPATSVAVDLRFTAITTSFHRLWWTSVVGNKQMNVGFSTIFFWPNIEVIHFIVFESTKTQNLEGRWGRSSLMSTTSNVHPRSLSRVIQPNKPIEVDFFLEGEPSSTSHFEWTAQIHPWRSVSLGSRRTVNDTTFFPSISRKRMTFKINRLLINHQSIKLDIKDKAKGSRRRWRQHRLYHIN